MKEHIPSHWWDTLGRIRQQVGYHSTSIGPYSIVMLRSRESCQKVVGRRAVLLISVVCTLYLEQIFYAYLFATFLVNTAGYSEEA
jgi:predicted AAA+ superfamily ATPase